MNTTTVILSISMMALVSLAYGQQDYHRVERSPEFTHVGYTGEENGFPNKISHFLHRIGWTEKVSPESNVCMVFIMDQPEIIYEGSYETERWMTIPFERSHMEADLILEAWMIQPFYSQASEEELSLESWMMVSFGWEEFTEVENWMTSTWTQAME